MDDSTSKVKLVPKWTSTVSGAALGIALILLGCCANVMTLEILTTSASHHTPRPASTHRADGSLTLLWTVVVVCVCVDVIRVQAISSHLHSSSSSHPKALSSQSALPTTSSRFLIRCHTALTVVPVSCFVDQPLALAIRSHSSCRASLRLRQDHRRLLHHLNPQQQGARLPDLHTRTHCVPVVGAVCHTAAGTLRVSSEVSTASGAGMPAGQCWHTSCDSDGCREGQASCERCSGGKLLWRPQCSGWW